MPFSSGVWFSDAPWFWKINGLHYDLSEFADLHPGGAETIRTIRERFGGDCTEAFYAHHLNAERALRVLEPFRVVRHDDALVPPPASLFHDRLRLRLRAALGASGEGPTAACVACFAWTVRGYAVSLCACLWSGWYALAALTGVFATWLGSFGHNFVHQPAYLRWSRVLDLTGLSSRVWMREHVLQHHIFTNTERDNHFAGTEPFFVVDPFAKRGALQRWAVFFSPFIASLGIFGNLCFRWTEIARGREGVSFGEVWLPLQAAAFVWAHGAAKGVLLVFLQVSVTSAWYFSIALINHNGASSRFGSAARDEQDDWAAWQLQTCVDFDTGCGFYKSVFLYLGLNRHGAHHVFPRLDFSKHSIAQRVIEEVCAEFGVGYVPARSLRTAYLDSLATFAAVTRRSA